MELIKNTIRVGNSAGVLLPKEWLGNKVKIILEKPDIKREVLEILMQEDLLGEILGVYIVGSYARDEQASDSDIDILVITENLNKRAKIGKYEIIFISKKELEKQLKNNVLPILPMLREAKPIINKDLIKKYRLTNINVNNLRYHLATTKSAMKVIEEDIKFSKENKENVSDASAYSLILRLRTLYILDCLKKKKIWNKKEFLNLIKEVACSTAAYERYIKSKHENSMENKLKVEEAERLLDYINEKIKEIEKWLQEKRD